MKYSELITFDPIDTVIQLSESNIEATAKKLVKKYMISNKVSTQLTDIVFPQLQYANPQDNKGIIIVGNYGTGKSHLMSLITSLAEYPDLYKEVKNESVSDKAKEMISGKFKVIRIEIGSTKQSLRNIICNELEHHLSTINISFTFPNVFEITNNKDALIEMMSNFHKEYPDFGLILAIDELLDYLRSRDDQELIFDLNFIRELGEVCRHTRFRFIAGLQESLFDSPRFQFMADNIRRVKDRFEQIRISREDIKFVVSERLLKKNEEQKLKIRKHLQKFTKLYGYMAETMDDFVNLFPIHPSYLQTFEKVYVAEKREVLRTISFEIKKMVNTELPEDQPGLLSYDSYWNILKENPSFRTHPEIREVVSASEVLENKVKQSMVKKQYIQLAIRVIFALSVHRLTTGDIYNQIGVTSTELRDDLCLHIPYPEIEADFLKTTIESVLTEIMKTVSGSYISFISDNSQYFLDLKKIIDYDQLIEQRSESLDENTLDRYYNDALANVLECVEIPQYVQGFKIWEHELEWFGHGVTRKGYLFFGCPNERSTAHPPREFYLYFLQPFNPPPFKDEKKSDEVLFKLTNIEKEFVDVLKLYGGCKEMAVASSPGTKGIYDEKARKYLQLMTKELKENFNKLFEVSYMGVTKKTSDWVKSNKITHFPSSIFATNHSFREYVNNLSSLCLISHFDDLAPEYPKFSMLVTDLNRKEYVLETIRWFKTNGQKTKQANSILDSLELLDGEHLQANKSRYAKYFLESLEKKGKGHVLNRDEIIQDIHGIELDKKYRLEPELVIIILVALAYSGEIAINYSGKKIDASSIDELMKMNIIELIEFKYIERPKDLPLNSLTILFDLLEIPNGLIINPETRDIAVTELQKKISYLISIIIKQEKDLPATNSFFGFVFLNDEIIKEYKNTLLDLKKFLEKLEVYNTEGRLKNFHYNSEEIKSMKKSFDILKDIEQISSFMLVCLSSLTYLTTAQTLLPKDNVWVKQIEVEKERISKDIQNAELKGQFLNNSNILDTFSDLKNSYTKEYIQIHNIKRLSNEGDRKKTALIKDPRLLRLQKLSVIDLLQKSQLIEFHNNLSIVKSCFTLFDKDLEKEPICPYCKLKPIEEKLELDVNILINDLDAKLNNILDSWKLTLIENLNDPAIQENFKLLGTKKRQIISKFLIEKELPKEVDNDFVEILQDVFVGFEKVEIKMDELKITLAREGLPCTVEEFEKRFKDYMLQLLKHKDPKKVRIIFG